MKHCLALLIPVVTAVAAFAAAPQEDAARALAQRVLGDAASHFSFEYTPAEAGEPEAFTLADRDGNISVSGNSALALSSGLNYYLKNYAGTSVSWYLADPVFIPDEFPPVGEAVTVSSRVPDRFFLNYCTFGYSMPYWNWEQWERLIDWMALNGVNMPLAITGQESVWLDVWKQHGLNEEDVLAYFTGPAHLPWHRMCNLDGYQGPLPKEWLDNQQELQKRILARERDFGMRPVLPAFAGHVPAKLAERYPDAAITGVSKWGGFGPEHRCSYLSPADSLFAVIQRDYIAAQTRLYGTDHLYGIDCFNEVDPPSWAPDSLTMAARGVFNSLDAADTDGVWVQMAWMFYYDRKNWTPERVRAYLAGVPHGRLKFLDYYCDFTELWPDNDSFHGHDFIWCYLGNFGGNSFIAGDHGTVKNRIANTLAKAPSVTGVGSTLEGLDVNPYMYECVLDMAWNQPLTQEQRISSLARRRAGTSPEAREAWQLMADSIYRSRIFNSQAVLLHARPDLEKHGSWVTLNKYEYDNADLFKAWSMMLDAAPGAQGRDSYIFDIVNIGRQALGNRFEALRDSFATAYRARDIEAAKAAGARMRELIDDCTSLLACHRTFSLKPWVDDARNNISHDPALQDYFEENARTLVTLWGSKSLTDYASRAYAELNDQYYGERWRRFIASVEQALADGSEWNRDAFIEQMRAFEAEWPRISTPVKYIEAPGDPVDVAKRLCSKWGR